MWSWFVGLLEQALIWFSSATGNVALGIILFTIAARLLILPLTLSSIRSSRSMQQLQPLMKELQRKYGKDSQKLQEETMKLYKEHKVNPVGGCLPLMLQLPIFFGVYQAVYHLFGGEQGRQYLSSAAEAALQDPAVAAVFSQKLFGVIEPGGVAFGPNGFVGVAYVVLPILSIVFQFLQTVMATPRVQDPQQKMMTQMMMFMPLVFGYIAFTFPQGAVLYWVVSSMVGVVQQYFISGWGSLANYLKFLPPDGKPTSLPTSAVAAVATDTGASDEASVATTRADFWDVMRPLTELQPAVASASSTEGGAELIVDKSGEPVDKASQAQMRGQVSPRRNRRRK
ncbi:YidC/Oxa1 family membrane protein insertase [Candidatus Chloroploca sp. Khr17]|uniref:YidC/Oxa1 family membrane protein insertase n=1 Tax=Candidatus Chloroploca sp. Khr17 TaxID=2496869 RepID=UPI00101C74CE|nr:YidC/Oxa1 family membrane protein insertase [Candidatus Chloroploca sp. Khr17]